MRPGVAVVILILVLGPSGNARGESKGKAHLLTREALSLFNAGQYERAIARFEEAYRLTRAPVLLFDIAQAYRLSGDCVRAFRYYGDYVRAEPAAANRASIRAKMVATARCAEAQQRPAENTAEPVASEPARAALPSASPSPSPPSSPSSPPSSPSPPSAAPAPVAVAAAAAPAENVAPAALVASPRPRSARPGAIIGVGIGLGISGLALVAAGAYFSVQATHASNEIGQLFQTGGGWDDHWRSVENDGRDATVTSAVLYSIGGALTVTGVTLLLVGRRSHRR